MKKIWGKIKEFALKVWNSKPVVFLTVFALLCAIVGSLCGALVELFKKGDAALGIVLCICWAFAIGPMVKALIAQVNKLMGEGQRAKEAEDAKKAEEAAKAPAKSAAKSKKSE